jgi:hypothetical protein
MPNNPEQIKDSEMNMQKRRTTLADGRYLIYYTFENSPDPAEEENKQSKAREPRPRAESSEERNV